MNTFTDQQLHEIRQSARTLAENEMENRGIADPDAIDFLAHFLFVFRHRWASFDEADVDSDAYEAVIRAGFDED